MSNNPSYDEEDEITSEELEKRLGVFTPFIGRLIVTFSYIEESINSILIETINERDFDIGYIIIADMTYYSKVNLLNNLYRHLFRVFQKPVMIKRLDALCKRLRECGSRRNEVVHAGWVNIDRTSSITTGTKIGKSGISHVSKKMDTDQIDKEIAIIEQVTDELWSLYDEAYAAIFSKKS